MHPLYIECIGGAAGFLTTLSLIPQVLKVLRDRQTAAISLPMYIAFTFGVFLWLVYGVLVHSAALIVSNIVTFVLAAAVLILKIRLERSGTSSDFEYIAGRKR